MSKKKIAIAFGLMLAFMAPVMAEPTTAAVRIISLRVKRNMGSGTTPAGLVYIQLASPQLGTDTYTIDLGHVPNRELFSLALEAFHAGKNVRIETNNCSLTAPQSPCAWGSELQSLYILE
jgi:type 1 fimbria pilin